MYNQQIQNILKNFGLVNYEKNIKQSYQLLMEIFHYSRIKSISNKNSFKSKNDLKLIFKNKHFINNVNFDKLSLFNILIIFSLLNSPFNNELNKYEVNSILEFIKNEDKNINHLEWQHIFGKLDVFNFEWIIYCIMEKQFKNNLSKDDLDVCFDIARMKYELKKYHTLSFKYLKKIIRLSSNKLKKFHNKFVKKINEKEKLKIENIDFNLKDKNVFNNKNLEFEYKLIDNSLDLFLFR